MFALVDCNNFYVSCERVFNPNLKNIPVVVLSNNDGCIISRSQEAKQMQIRMGDPIFLYQMLIETKQLIALSANFTLYADMSQRVFDVIESFAFPMEIYSIDEAFLRLDLCRDTIPEMAQAIHEKIYKWTGIKTAIGIAKTKTLAKLAASQAKHTSIGHCFLYKTEDIYSLLKQTPPQKIWGIGHRMQKQLFKRGIYSAYELLDKEDAWILQHLKTSLLKTVYELKQIPCIFLNETLETKKSILSSRSFHQPIYTHDRLQEALCSFVSSACRKLRKQKKTTRFLMIFISTSRFDKQFYNNSFSLTLPLASSYTPELLSFAKTGLKEIYKKGYKYKKAGVILLDLCNETEKQTDLFLTEKNSSAKRKLMQIMDMMNHKKGKNILYFASEGIKQRWKKSPLNKSAPFTTSLHDLLHISTDFPK